MGEQKAVQRGRPILNGHGLLLNLAFAGTLALLLWHASVYLFLTDDAFISFRYARNLAQGDGLVFNPGFERVEGYSNFLWVLLLAAGAFVGIVPESIAHPLSLLSTIGLWALVAAYSRRRAIAAARPWLTLIPVLLLAATRSIAVWSSSGLETRFFELLIVAGVLRSIGELERRLEGGTPRPWAAVLFALATLTRPDGLLISGLVLGVGAAWLLTCGRFRLRAQIPSALAFGVIVGAHYLFRFLYYGYLFPNTFYAKVEGQSWGTLGGLYFGSFILEYAAYLWLPLLAAALLAHRRNGTSYVPLLFGACVVPHAFYIASIGGDHFEYRPLDLYLPFLFMLMGDGLQWLALFRRARGATAALGLLILIGLTALPYQTRRQFTRTYIAGFPGLRDEEPARSFMDPARDPVYRWPGLRVIAGAYRRAQAVLSQRYIGIRQEEHALFLAKVIPEGKHLRRMIDRGSLPADLHVAMSCVGAIPYYSDLRVLDRHGLTDAHVAHSPPDPKGKAMAHRKKATLAYAAESHVDFWAQHPVHSLRPLNNPRWIKLIRGAAAQTGVMVADVGEGFYMIGKLPGGVRQARERMPALEFQPFLKPRTMREILSQAIDALHAALRRNPDDEPRTAELARMLWIMQRVPENYAVSMRLVEMQPESIDYWGFVARAAAGLGHAEEARQAARRALDLALEFGNEASVQSAEELAALYGAQPSPKP